MNELPHHKTCGTVFLVGAGPGAADLLTVRGQACLKRAALVVHDYLANSDILRLAPQARSIALGHSHTASGGTLDAVYDEIIRTAQAGLDIVRLKGGDPSIFARLSEELTYLRNANIPYEIIPGITAASAACAYTELPLTDAKYASALALITGQQRCDSQEILRYADLSQFPGTLVFYMGVTTLSEWSHQLLDGKMNPETPVAIICDVSRYKQRVLTCTLKTVLRTSADYEVRPPALFVIGEAARNVPNTSWFSRRPLFGQRILITRPAEQSTELGMMLTELGADVLYQPTIKILPLDDYSLLDSEINQVHSYRWIVFSSSNGVTAFMDRLRYLGLDARALGGVKLAVIGPGTAKCLAEYHLHADIMPETFQAEDLADALIRVSKPGDKFLLIRASRGRDVLSEKLSSAEMNVTQVTGYLSEDIKPDELDKNITQLLAQGNITWITVTSSAIARALIQLFPEKDLHRTKLVSISPLTSAVLRTLGYEPAAEAQVATMQGVADALIHLNDI